MVHTDHLFGDHCLKMLRGILITSTPASFYSTYGNEKLHVFTSKKHKKLLNTLILGRVTVGGEHFRMQPNESESCNFDSK